MGAGLMELLAWLAGTWKSGAWKVGAWEADGAEVELVAGGGAARPKKTRRPAWVIPPQFAKPRRGRREEDEALLLCDAL